MWEVFVALPTWFQYSFVFILGSILGSFLDVCLLRFKTGHSINGRSHCLSCGQDLRWFELFPVISYLLLRGRCRRCDAGIPIRLLGMEVLCGLVLIGTFMSSDTVLEFGITSGLLLLLLMVGVYDLRHFIIPNQFVIWITVCSVLLLVNIWWLRFDSAVLLHHVSAAGGAFLFFAGLWFVSKGRWIGFGDAKLAVPLALLLGPWGTFSFIVFSFWVGAVVSVALLLLQRLLRRGKVTLPFTSVAYTMKTEVPFAPFMIAAFLLVFYGQYSALGLISHLFYGL